MVWQKILRPFTRQEIEQSGKPINLELRNARELRSQEGKSQIVHTAEANPNNLNRDHYIQVETTLRDKFGFDSVKVSANTNSNLQRQTLFRASTATRYRPTLRNSSSLGVQVFLGNFSGNRQREIAIIDQDDNVGVFEWNPFT